LISLEPLVGMVTLFNKTDRVLISLPDQGPPAPRRALPSSPGQLPVAGSWPYSLARCRARAACPWPLRPSSDRKRATGLDQLHRELRVDAGQTRQLGQLVHVEGLVGGLVGDRDAHDVIGQAEHAAALDNLVERGESRLEGLNRRPVLEGELDVHGDLESTPVGLELTQNCAIYDVHWQIMPQCGPYGATKQGNSACSQLFSRYAHHR